MNCRKCRYVQISTFKLKDKTVSSACCSLSRIVVNPDAEADCKYYNADLSKMNICYNCDYYAGGGDWGLFCTHKDMYHHLGRFNDKPCKFFKEEQQK